MSDSEGATGTVGITGAYGYVGSLLRRAFGAAGWRTVALVRTPRPDDATSRHFDLADESVAGRTVAGLDALVHAAWDLSLTDRETIWEINVEGSRRLLARAEAVSRVIFISSMSAYAGTRQLYGQAKLAVEDDALRRGQCVVRPGLVYGDQAGGMVGALTRVARWPLVPVVGGSTRQFPVHADDLAAAVVALAAAAAPPAGPIGVAQPEALSFAALIRALSPRDVAPRTVPVPWPLPYGLLRVAERAGLKLAFRSDSLLGLVRAAPSVPGLDALDALGVSPRVLVDPGRLGRR
jgi:nucleoside-diphosphate-sugar epimerase